MTGGANQAKSGITQQEIIQWGGEEVFRQALANPSLTVLNPCSPIFFSPFPA